MDFRDKHNIKSEKNNNNTMTVAISQMFNQTTS